MNTHCARKVSYVITTRNRSDKLSETLSNVREFIRPQDELIVVDAASSDDTATVVGRNGDIVTFFLSEPDYGEAHGYNKAILASTGDVIKFITDDDYFHASAMHECLAALDSDQTIDVLVGGGITWSVNRQGERTLLGVRRMPNDVSVKAAIVQPSGPLLSGQGLFVRRRALPVLGLLNVHKKLVDWDYFVRLVQAPLSIKYIDVHLYDHLVWHGSGCQELFAQPHYWTELGAGLLQLGDWKALASHPPTVIAASLQLPGAATEWRSACEMLALQVRNPRSTHLRFLNAVILFSLKARASLGRGRAWLRRLCTDRSHNLQAQTGISDGQGDVRWSHGIW